MKYGYFDDRRKEYVIQTPDTPLPWINYLGSNQFFSLLSNTGGGYSFYRDAKLRRITRYRYNNVPNDIGSRFFYIKDQDEIWSPCYKPVKSKLDYYSCRHGMGYSIISGSRNSIVASITFFVPLKDNCELQHVTLTNEGDSKKSFDLFGVVEWCLWNAVDDAANYQRNLSIGEVEVENSVVYHKSEYRERRNHYGFYSVNADTCGFDTNRDSFLGADKDWSLPDRVRSGQSTDSIASGWYPIASHQISISLEPGETKELVFILGYIENEKNDKWDSPNKINKTKAKEMISKYESLSSVNKAFSELAGYWEDLLSNYQVHSALPQLDRMVNIWNQYQCMATFNMSRSASYYETGTGRGMGFRDSCQDLLGFVHMIPEQARERIIDIASIQFEDGSTYHQYQPLTKQGNADIGGGFNDDPLWLIGCTTAYIRETGDMSILDEMVPFNNVKGTEKPLLEHLKRSVYYTINHKGPHNLPLIGRADWNDCLNLNCFSEEPGESFQTCENIDNKKAESIFIGAMFVKYAGEYADLCSRLGNTEEADYVNKEIQKMTEAIETSGWDGSWFLRAYDSYGDPVGSHICEEGQIYIEPQGFCVMAGIGIQNGNAKKALDSVEERLTTPYGIQLLNPCYTKYHINLGEITSYPPGYKENGGIFCHNNPWVSIAHTVIGQRNEAFESYKRISPAFTEEISDIHRTEPYVYSQMIAGREAPNYGEAKNSWLTGTASWSFVNVSQFILGIRADYDGLRIEPCLPDELNEITIIREFRDARFNIHINNRKTGKIQIMVDGEKIKGTLIPLIENKKLYTVEVDV
ncbi:glycosyl transferase [Anaerocolumna aminovalerica]|uniref:Cellobiose phosphorylase n=1 Tax=Anaerocolumna aminovalerica TaxID=1527 RepID=A0A1I5FJN9_9FIRM|nr:glycosyl transferase [Anaerocolumna aminovalerica]SFO23826.1 cellobiose phosphorylase [Anaerocolumna aminovalerica]